MITSMQFMKKVSKQLPLLDLSHDSKPFFKS
jgi:hypothetical protein